MSEGIIDQVAVKDTELLDWQETEVISITAHPFGWEILWAGEDNEPATADPVLFRTESMREALAQAKARQEAEINGTAAALQEAEELLPEHADIPESQLRPGLATRVDDAGCD